MRNILGLDLSLTSSGWFLPKTGKYGSFKTSTKDGIDIKRFMLQRDRIVNIINENSITHVGIEQPFLRSFNTEKLYALHQFVLEACYTRHLKVVYITPLQVKQYATGNTKADKNEIVFKTREVLGLKRERINNDACDAYWVSRLTETFWKLYYEEITKEQLTQVENYIFIENKSKKLGILYKKNDSFFIF